MRGEYSNGVSVGTSHKTEKKRHLFTPLSESRREQGGLWPLTRLTSGGRVTVR